MPLYRCITCKQEKPADSFTRYYLKRPKQRCSMCVKMLHRRHYVKAQQGAFTLFERRDGEASGAEIGRRWHADETG